MQEQSAVRTSHLAAGLLKKIESEQSSVRNSDPNFKVIGIPGRNMFNLNDDSGDDKSISKRSKVAQSNSQLPKMLPEVVSNSSRNREYYAKEQKTEMIRGSNNSSISHSNKKRQPFGRHDASIQSIRNSQNSSQGSGGHQISHNLILRNAHENQPDSRQFPLKPQNNSNLVGIQNLNQRQHRVLKNISKGNLPSYRSGKKKSPIIFVPQSENKIQDWYMKHDGSIQNIGSRKESQSKFDEKLQNIYKDHMSNGSRQILLENLRSLKQLPSINILPKKQVYQNALKKNKKKLLADSIITEEQQYIDSNYIPQPLEVRKPRNKSPGKKTFKNILKSGRKTHQKSDSSMDPVSIVIADHYQSDRNDGSIDTAINNQSAFFSNRNIAQQLGKPSGQGRAGLNLKNTASYYGGLNPYGNLSKRGSTKNIKGRIPQIDQFLKEDMYDQLIMLRSEIKILNEDINNTKTKNAIFETQLKQKDHFIQEIIQSTTMVDKAITQNVESGRSSKNGELIKLKAQLNSLQQQIQLKTQENIQLEKSLKESNVLGMKDEMKIYTKQYKKLENLTKFTIELAKKNGLEAELLQDKRAKDFVALNNKDMIVPDSKGSVKDNPIFKQLINQNGKMSQKLDTERQKLDDFSHQLSILQNDRLELISIDRRKNEQIYQLQQKLEKMQSQLGSPLRIKSKLSLKSNRSPQRSQRTFQKSNREATSKLTLNISKNKIDEYSSQDEDDKIRQLQLEKSSVEKQLVREKQEKMSLLSKIKAMEKQKTLNKGEVSQKSLETIPNDFQSKHDKQIRDLSKKVKDLEKKAQKNNEVEILKKELEEQKKSQERFKGQFTSLMKQVQQKDAKIQVLETKIKATLQKQPSKGHKSITSSQVTASELRAEAKYIEQQLNNVKESDIDERSDPGLSMMQSQIPGITSSEISVPKVKSDVSIPKGSKKGTVGNDTIKEETAEEFEFTRKPSQDMFTAGRSMSHAVHADKSKKLTVSKKDDKLMQQLDNVRDEVSDLEEDSYEQDFSQENLTKFKFVEFKQVEKGFERLGRLLQLKRKPLDSIEQEILGKRFKPNESVKISQLQVIFIEKLGLSQSEAQDFARFIIEEKDEEQPDMTSITFNPSRQVNSQYIPVRLMSNFKKYPAVYTDQEEEEVISKFQQQFNKTEMKNLVQTLNEQEEAIVGYSLFKKILGKTKMTEDHIDCAYVYLCRGEKGPFKVPSDKVIQEKITGFDSQKANMLFGDKYNEESEEEYTEEQYTQEEDVKEQPIVETKKQAQASSNYSESFMEEDIDNGDLKQAAATPKQIKVDKVDSTIKPVDKSQSEAYEEEFLEEPIESDRSDQDFGQEESHVAALSSRREAVQQPQYDVKEIKVIQDQVEDAVDEQISEEMIEERQADETINDEISDEIEDEKKEESFEEEIIEDEEDVQKNPEVNKEPEAKKEEEKPEVKEEPKKVDQPKAEEPREEVQKVQEEKKDIENPVETVELQISQLQKQEESKPEEMKQVEEQPKEDAKVEEVQEAKESPKVSEKPAEPPKAESAKNEPKELIQNDYEEAPAKDSVSQKSGTSSVPKFRINFDKIDDALKQEIMQKMGIENISHLRVNEEQITKAEEYEYYDEEEENPEKPKVEEKVSEVKDDVLQIYIESILKNYPDLKDSCRDIFREIIYSKKQDGQEIEIVLTQDLIYKIEEQIHPKTFTQIQKTEFNEKFGSEMKYTELYKIFEEAGIKDFRAPKGNPSSAHLNYEMLDLRSIRLINRLIHYLGTEQITFSDFMREMIQVQTVKTKQSNTEVEIFMATKFFEKLQKSKVKKSKNPHPNLCAFLCIDTKYKNYLMLKKLKRCIIDFNQSDYFQSVGLKKQKLDDGSKKDQKKQEEYEYYDEEADKAEEILPKPVAAEEGYEYYDEEEDKSQVKTAAPPAPAPAPAEANGGYEYYDEEDAEIEATVKVPQEANPTKSNSQPPATKTTAQTNAEYEYYDEEEEKPTDSIRVIGNNSVPLANDLQPITANAQSPNTNANADYEYYDEEEEKKSDVAKPQAAAKPEYEYYDEEEEKKSEKKLELPPPDHVVPEQKPAKKSIADFDYYDEEEPKEKEEPPAKKSIAEFDYYDEEEPKEESKAPLIQKSVIQPEPSPTTAPQPADQEYYDEEGYYDEEDPKQSPAKPAPVRNSIETEKPTKEAKATPKPADQYEYYDEEEPKGEAKKAAPKVEYEYYDEEEP